VLAAVMLIVSALQFTTMDPNGFQVFIRRWQPESAAHCAVITSGAQWKQTFAPAAVAYGNKPFAPPPDWWKTHAALVVARSTYSAEDKVLQIQSVRNHRGALIVSYEFRRPPRASSTMNAWIGVAVDKPLPSSVVFVENGNRVCRRRRYFSDAEPWQRPRRA
jgi:hypothetical protein